MREQPGTIDVAILSWHAATEGLVAIARGFPGNWDGPSNCGAWTNRELLAHLATGYVERLEALRLLIEHGAMFVPREDIDAVNARNVAAVAGEDIPALIERMIATRAEVEALLRRLRPADLEKLWRRGKVADTLIDLSDHDLEHARQLRTR